MKETTVPSNVIDTNYRQSFSPPPNKTKSPNCFPLSANSPIPHSSHSMEGFRSKSCKDGRMQIESYYYGGGIGKAAAPPTSMHDLRCYSANHAGLSHSNSNPNWAPYDPTRETKLKKSKSSGSKNWSLSDPELQRKRRVAGYRVYAVEGKMKGSLKKSLRWIKDTCTHVVYGWW